MDFIMDKYSEILASPNRPTIGLVLSSGGIRPFAAIELFSFLEDANIPIDLLVGCSGGAIVSVLKALGYKSSEMRELVKLFIKPDLFKIDFETVGAMLHIPFMNYSKGKAIMQGQYPQREIAKIVGDRNIEDLLIKTVLQTTDLETGEGVALSEGNLAKALYASLAIVPFFPPIFVNGRWLVDGNFSNSTPTLEAVSRNIDIIISVDFNIGVKYQPSNIGEYYDFSMTMATRDMVHCQNALAVDIHHYEIIFIEVNYGGLINLWDTTALPEVYKRGKIAVDSAKSAIISAIEEFPLK